VKHGPEETTTAAQDLALERPLNQYPATETSVAVNPVQP
jgi:hypothetical protein